MDVAVIAYHSGDNYQNTYSIARLNYYGSMIPGLPTVIFDGVTNSVGGGGNMYPTYLAKYNSRISVPSSYTIDVAGANSGMIDYELELTVEKVAATIDNPVMHVVVTESHIPFYWGGLTEVNYVERLMAPNQYGTLLDFSGGNTEELTINFTLDQSWVNEECELVVFLQNSQTKEILQGIKRDIMDFGTTNTIDAAILNVVAPNSVCNNSFIPKVEIANYGLDNLTSLDIVYHVNSEPSDTYTWTGNLAFLESEIIVLPEVSFTLENSNTFIVEAENPNGEDDQYPSNNTYTVSMADAENLTSPVSLVLLLDDNPEETSWELLDSDGNVLYSGGSYTTPNLFMIETFTLNETDCYSFIIYDEEGDGLTGSGLYKLAYASPPIIFAQGTDFGFEEQVQFGIGLTGEEEFVVGTGIEVYPNPTDQKATVSFELLKSQTVEMKVFNSVGAMVYATEVKAYSAGKHILKFDREGLTSGIYYINLMIGESVEVRKLIIR